MKKGKSKKLIRVITNIVMFLFFAICVGVLTISVSSKKSSERTANVFGYQMRIVVSSSMEKCDATDVSSYDIKEIPIKSAVFIEQIPSDGEKLEQWYRDLKVGDILTFKYMYSKQETITHRIVEIETKSTGGYIIRLEGDNKSSNITALSQHIDTSKKNSPNYIVGKVVRVSYALGLVITATQNPLGAVLIVFIPCVLVIGYEVHRITSMLGEPKKKKACSIQEQKELELEILKEQVRKLQKSVSQVNGGKD